MKIVLIGPVFPYKGGISHYTSLLCKELRKKHTVEMVSYSMQYPKILYKKEQKDFSNRSFEVANTQYWINTANPLNWMRSAKRIKDANPDIIIVEWWHPYFAPCYFVITKLLRKYKKIFICHNVFPHERFPMDRFLTKLVLKQSDYFVVQSNLDKKDLLDVIPEAKYLVTPHPTYNVFKMKNLKRSEARKNIGMGDEVSIMLFFGFVREYKGLKYLLKAMPIVKEKNPDAQLWVVGDFGEDKEEYLALIEKYELQQNIRIVDGYVPDQEVEKYFAATDLVVLPYISATQSGIAQIAYGFNKPVIATNVGGLPDVIEDGKTGYIVEKENEVELAEAINRYFFDADRKSIEENIKNKSSEFSWETMVQRIEKLLL